MTRCAAAVQHQPGQPMRIQQVELAEPGPGEVLVRTVTAGICGTDLHFASGALPYPRPVVLGHEASGIVEAVGDHTGGLAPGDRVIVCDRSFCGHCAACLTGHMVYCTDPGAAARQRHRMRINGQPVRQYLGVAAFAELMLLDATALVAMPPGLSFDAAALLSCALTTGLATVFNVAAVAPASTVAVFGCGAVGLAVVQAARIAGAAVIIAVDPVAHRRGLALRLGATATVDPHDADPIQTITTMTGTGVDHAIEAVGQARTAAQAFAVLRPGGQATIVGLMPADTDIILPARLLRQGRSLTGTVMGNVRTRADIPRYAALAMRGTLTTDDLITGSHPLDAINDAIADADARHGIRTMIHFR